MKCIVLLACLVYAATALPYGPQPQATSYIYRSDNNGPASLITLGPQPEIWGPHLPVPQPIQYLPAPEPLLYNAHPVNEIILEGNGNDFEEKEEAARGESSKEGYVQHDEHKKADSGEHSNEDEESSESEEEGEHAKHYDEEDTHGEDSEESDEHSGEKHGHEESFDNGNDVTGYHKVFHKDEFKKDHDFYDVADKSGHFHKHGYGNEHHGSEEGAHKKNGHSDAGHGQSGFSEQDDLLKADYDEEDQGHEAEESEDSHYHGEEEHGKKSEVDGPHHSYEYED